MCLNRRLLCIALGVALFLSGHLDYWLWLNVSKRRCDKTAISADRAIFRNEAINAVRSIDGALDVERAGNFAAAENFYNDAFIAYSRLEIMSFFKHGCMLFAQGKYSAALDRLTDVLKYRKDLVTLCACSGGGWAGRVYVCMYFENGRDSAEAWLDDFYGELDAQGKRFVSVLRKRANDEKVLMAAKDGLSDWEKGQVILYWKLLDDIDAQRKKAGK